MIGYVTLGTNDMQRAIRFYEQLLTLFEVKRGFENDRFVLWYPSKPGRPGLGVIKPHDGKAATIGNGGMVALAVDSPAKVDQMHKKAMELGGKDEGAPGPRGGGFYGAYFRDLDGNKLCVFTMVKDQ
jgi:catechol 2,3-dioxygenase-like lactoylglutathione lyase family enzyme